MPPSPPQQQQTHPKFPDLSKAFLNRPNESETKLRQGAFLADLRAKGSEAIMRGSGSQEGMLRL